MQALSRRALLKQGARMRVRARKYRRLRKAQHLLCTDIQPSGSGDSEEEAKVQCSATSRVRNHLYAGGHPNVTSSNVTARTGKWEKLEIKFANSCIRKFFGEGGQEIMNKTLAVYLSEQLKW